MPPSQQERRTATSAALVAAARELFAERAFGDVSADEIVAAAGVTRGALHHHFGDKRGLFREVFEQLEAEISAELARVLLVPGARMSVAAALTAFLDICERPAVSRIALTEAPAVLGWQTWRRIEAEHGLGLLKAMLADSPAVGDETPAPVVSQLLLSAAIEGALLIAHADDTVRTRRQVEASLLMLFGGLLPD